VKRSLLPVLLSFAGWSACLEVSAQQDPQFSQYMFSRLPVNAAYAGANDAICGSLLYRNQWTGFGGEPKTTLFSFDMPAESLHGGVGLSVYASDQLGNQKNMNIRGAYAFRHYLSEGSIAVGVDAGYHQLSPRDEAWIANDDPTTDPYIPGTDGSGGALDLGFGVYYQSDKMYVGVSATHITEGEIDYANVRTSLARHYWLMAGYSAELSPSLTLKPAIMVKSDAVSTQLDANANLFINNRFWVGAGYRLQDAIVIMAGLEVIPNLKLGYSYDYTTSNIRTYSSGTHEIMLGYCFMTPKKVKRTFHRNVRML
jgi:type IX secretion system PorP/SprF family membrane protein